MQEKIIKGKKNGMLVLILTILVELVSLPLAIYGAVLSEIEEHYYKHNLLLNAVPLEMKTFHHYMNY